MFKYDFTILNSYSYQIRITPKLYIFMYNLGIKVTVMDIPDPNLYALNGRPFHTTVYNQTVNLIWSGIITPSVT